jgi:hypothetical protein
LEPHSHDILHTLHTLTRTDTKKKPSKRRGWNFCLGEMEMEEKKRIWRRNDIVYRIEIETIEMRIILSIFGGRKVCFLWQIIRTQFQIVFC